MDRRALVRPVQPAFVALFAVLLALLSGSTARAIPPPAAPAATNHAAPGLPVNHPPTTPPVRNVTPPLPTVVHLAPPHVAAPAEPPSRIESLVDTVKTGRLPSDMSQQELESVQAHALHTIQREFKDPGVDAALLGAVSGKMAYYRRYHVDDGALGHRPTASQQVDALKVVIHTFRGADEGDVALRAAALDKLGAMGTRGDVEEMMPIIRKPPHSADLHAGLTAAKAILARDGSPVPRGSQRLSPQVRALLGKPSLSEEEKAVVIKDVLEHGEIVDIKKNVSPTMNAVYFLKFRETVPGPNGERIPIEGVWKEESTFPGKQKPNFSREVAAYEFTSKFAKTNVVPVTVEAKLAPDQIPGPEKPYGIGSIQYKIPGGESVGRGYPDSRLLKPKYEAFLNTPEGQRQLDEIRTYLYVMNDPEKLPNSGGYNVANFGNILAAPDSSKPGGYKLYLIDNGTALGAQSQFGANIRRDMLPNHPTQASVELGHASADEIRRTLAPMIGQADADDVANRAAQAHP